MAKTRKPKTNSQWLSHLSFEETLKVFDRLTTEFNHSDGMGNAEKRYKKWLKEEHKEIKQ